MAIQIRLFFEPFCTAYNNSGQTVNRLRGEKQRKKMKQEILGQLAKYGMIKAHPLKISFDFVSIKEYPTHNYGLMAQWILESFLFAGILPDLAPGIIGEISIHTKKTNHTYKQGVIITIDKYEKQVP